MAEMNESDRILGLLQQRHSGDEWATFTELRGGTGTGDGRRIDFFAMNIWPSKSFRSIAYEIKASRSDFGNELHNPRKRGLAESVAHECYFVVPHGLIVPDEVPEGWGLIYADRGGLKTAKRAMQRTSVEWPVPFVASLARRVADPPQRSAPILWRYAGRDMTEAELIACADEVHKSALARDRDKLIRQGVDSVIGTVEYKTAARLMSRIKTIVGCRYEDDRLIDAFDEFLENERALTMPNINRVKRAILELGGVLGNFEEMNRVLQSRTGKPDAD